jgi:hypothetical protein
VVDVDDPHQHTDASNDLHIASGIIIGLGLARLQECVSPSIATWLKRMHETNATPPGAYCSLGAQTPEYGRDTYISAPVQAHGASQKSGIHGHHKL